MLPGFRFLFAAIMLSMSLLVFAMGAAALLRAAHEEFASSPSWRSAPEVMFAQPAEATRPSLAMLRVDMPAAEQVQNNAPATTAPTEQSAMTAAPAEPERIAALEEASPTEIVKAETKNAEIPAAESPVTSEAALASAATPSRADETRVATIATSEVSWQENPTAPAPSEPIGALVTPVGDIATTKIATLGEPPVGIETLRPAKVSDAKPDEAAVRKRQQARRAAHRRRLAALRAQLLAQAAAQLGNPFGQPPAPIIRTR